MKTLIQPFHSLSRILHDFRDIALNNQHFNAHDSLSPRWQVEGNSFIIKVPVPGMSKEDISMHLEGRVLVISNKESATSNENVKNLKNIGYKHFITLPDSIDTDSIGAKCTHGLLTIIVDKKEPPTKHTVIKVIGPESGQRVTGRLDSLWNKIKEKIDVRRLVHNRADN